MKKRTVKIELPRSHSYSRMDLISALAKYMQLEQLEALGTAKFNNVWEATLCTKTAADRLLTYGNINVGEVSGRLTSMDATRLKVRIHWMPYWVPNKVLDTVLRKQLPEGAVLEGIGTEKSSIKGAQHVATLVRFALVKYPGNPGDLPHLLNLHVEEQVLEVLLTIQGRKPVCLRCKQVGHVRQTCDAPYCVGCRGYGHSKEECRNRFAAAVSGHSATETNLIPDEEMSETRPGAPEEEFHGPPGAAASQGQQPQPQEQSLPEQHPQEQQSQEEQLLDQQPLEQRTLDQRTREQQTTEPTNLFQLGSGSEVDLDLGISPGTSLEWQTVGPPHKKKKILTLTDKDPGLPV